MKNFSKANSRRVVPHDDNETMMVKEKKKDIECE